jgi:hypothetical protein
VIIQDLLESDDASDFYTLEIEQDYTKGGKMAQDFWTGPGNMPTNVTTDFPNDGIHPCVGTTGNQTEYCDTDDTYFVVDIPDMGFFISNGTQYDGGLPTSLGPQNATLGNQTSFAEMEHFDNIPIDQLSAGMILRGPIDNSTFHPFLNYTGFNGDVNGDSSVFGTITFMTNATGDVVLYYGGHISDTKDYESIGKESAVEVKGSPYHNAIEDSNVKNGCCGQQDMQLSSSAVVQLGLLNLTKIVDNTNGGTAVPNDWILFANGSQNNEELDFGIKGGVKEFNEIIPNIVYTLTEIGFNDTGAYTPDDWICTEGDGITFDQVDGTIMIEAGQNATCTITNTASAPMLNITKIVNNTSGGNATASDFYVSANRTSGSGDSSRDINRTGENTTFVNVFANTVYELNETSLDGYVVQHDWDCTGDGDFDEPSNTIELGLGESAECVIVNTDVAPTLNVTKIVNNNVGGNGTASEFWLSANATGLGDDSNDFNRTGEITTDVNVTAGVIYELDETMLAGYELDVDWVCTGDGVFDSNA